MLDLRTAGASLLALTTCVLGAPTFPSMCSGSGSGGVGGSAGAPASCGNGVLETGETCDGAELGGHSCFDHYEDHFVSGSVKCAADCRSVDYSGCIAAVCGNGVAESGEYCDGSDLAKTTCREYSYDRGTLGCKSDCTFDFSGCVFAVCGNGTAEFGEQCDGADLRGQTCTDQGLTGGTLGCTSDCKLDLSACTIPVCGDGKIEGSEQCEGTNLGSYTGKTCHDVSSVYTSGVPACGDNCMLNLLPCAPHGCVPIARFGVTCY